MGLVSGTRPGYCPTMMLPGTIQLEKPLLVILLSCLLPLSSYDEEKKSFSPSLRFSRTFGGHLDHRGGLFQELVQRDLVTVGISVIAGSHGFKERGSAAVR